MRNLMIAVFIAVVLPLAGCKSEPSEPTQAEELLDGTHQLRKMSDTEISGGRYFLAVSVPEGKTKTTILIRFSWKMNDGTYAISSLPLEKIRVNFDEKIATPTIEFNRWWKCDVLCGGINGELQQLINNSVEYVVITMKEGDWPQMFQVNLPLNN